MSKIRIGIVGYGNLGRGVEASVKLQPDMELVGVFSRRKGLETVSGVPTYTMEDLPNFKGKIDVMVLCGGSATDLIEQTPMVTKYFNCIDSFDTHARIPEHFANVDKVAKEAKTATLISCGWDPGMFSLQRVYAESILPHGKSYTFWGRGVSKVTPMLFVVSMVFLMLVNTLFLKNNTLKLSATAKLQTLMATKVTFVNAM